MKNLYKHLCVIALVLSLFFISASVSLATTLPENIQNVIKDELPQASIRFDGLVSLPDGTIYLPVLPSNPDKKAKGKIVYTVPANKKLSQYPNVVLFDTNFALLKVIKTKDGKSTIAQPKDIPLVVKTGLFPQDMLVPPGLYIPDELKIMMGDLKISTTSSRVNDIFKEGVLQKNTSVTTKFQPVQYMSGKTLLISSLDSKIVNVVPTDSTTPKFTLTLENLPKFILPVCNDSYILVASASKTYIDVADVKNEVIAKKLDLSYQPSEIILNSDKTRAYVSVCDDQSIFVIDLKSMSLLEKIKIKGYPKNISISQDDKIIVYQDKNTGDIYTLSLDESYLNKYVYNASNVSKLIIKDKNIYILSRTLSELHVVDTEIKDLIYKQKVAQKPVDMILRGNILYILGSSNELDTFNLDDFSYNNKIKFGNTGFAKNIVPVENTNLFLITNVSDKKYFVYDYKNNQILQSVSLPVMINDLQIINKKLN